MDVHIRPAEARDLGRINDIYNYFVARSTCTYQEEPDTIDDRRRWLDVHGERYPVTVAEVDGAVVGWGALSPFHPRSAYRFSTENSIYVDPDWHRRGIGSRLLADAIVRARAIGHHTIVALIDAEQPASVALHARYGFVEVARLREVGYKFDRWLDVIYMQRMLG